MITHLPCRSWCDHCVRGKASDDAHVTRQEVGTGVPRWGMNCFYLGREPEKAEARDGAASSSHEPAAFRPAVEAQGGDGETQQKRCSIALARPLGPCSRLSRQRRGGDGFALSVALQGLKFTGRTAVICLVDQERSIKGFADLAQTHRQHSRHEEVYTERVDLDSAILPWLNRHAGWSVFTYNMKVDGKTPYERLRHTAECRTRFEQLLGRGEAGRPAQNDAGSSAQAPRAAETDAYAQVDSAAGHSVHAAAAGSCAHAAGSPAQDDAGGTAQNEDATPNEGSPAKAARLTGGLPILREPGWLAGPEGASHLCAPGGASEVLDAAVGSSASAALAAELDGGTRAGSTAQLAKAAKGARQRTLNGNEL